MNQDREKQYFVVTQNAIPEVLLKVVEVKRLLAGKPPVTVSEATAKVGLSRSSFYKYKDDIFEFHENAQGKTSHLFWRSWTSRVCSPTCCASSRSAERTS